MYTLCKLTPLLVVVVGVLCAFLLSGSAEASNIRAWLETPHAQYKFCESIYVYLFVENNGDDAVDVVYVDDWCVTAPKLISLRLTDETGKEVRDGGLFSDPTPNDTVHLDPGDSAVFVFDVLGVFGKGGFHTKYPPCLPTGKYVLEGKYMGEAPLAPISFEILPLDDAEEKQIAKFAKVWNSSLKKKARFDAYMDAYDNLKSTVFGDLPCRLLFMSQPSASSAEQRTNFAAEYIKRYPDKGETGDAIRALRLNLNTERQTDLLRQIPAIKTNHFLRLMFKTTCALDDKMALYREVMK